MEVRNFSMHTCWLIEGVERVFLPLKWTLHHQELKPVIVKMKKG